MNTEQKNFIESSLKSLAEQMNVNVIWYKDQKTIKERKTELLRQAQLLKGKRIHKFLPVNLCTAS
ncbi:MAG TPA: hypothetical protein PLF31_02555 [Candidatus Paceibacterota bacterium]|nr:hypothetical protein [Candidatus Paceibacterota bacterium]